jgi:hypothetical protein
LRFVNRKEHLDWSDAGLTVLSGKTFRRDSPGASLVLDKHVRGLALFKIGGQPMWVQGPAIHTCQCGSPMGFLCQVPENYPFPKAPNAPVQPDCISDSEYGFLLGNEIYIFACEAQCSPFAVYPVAQN